MKKKLFTILIAFLCIFSMHTVTVRATEDVIPNDETGIPDKVLYHSILSALDKKDGGTFTRQEAAAVDEVFVSLHNKQTCQSLKGIGCLVNLRHLDLWGISCLDGIEELKNLTDLGLSHIRIMSGEFWKPLAGMKSLENLDISGCNLSNLKKTGIENLTNLKSLYAGECGLKKVDELKNLKKLEILELDDNRLTDIRALKGLTNLKILYLSNNRLNDINGVQRFKKLERLSFDHNSLKKLPDLRGLKNLKELNLLGNYLAEQEIKTKIPQQILKNAVFQKYAFLCQRSNAVIHVKSPAGLGGITRNTKKISGKISLIPGYKNGYYICLANPDSSKYRKKRWKVKSDGSFELNNLDLRSWAGDIVSLQALIQPTPEMSGTDGWYEVNSVTFQVRK